MRVLHLVTSDQRRGAEVDGRYIAELLQDRVSLTTVRALTPCPPGHTPLGALPLGPSPLHPQTLRALRRAALRHDVVVAHGSRTLPAARLALLGTGVPFVYRAIGTPQAWANTALRRARVRWMLEGAALVAALGEASRRDFVQHYGLDPDKVVVAGVAQPDSHFLPPSSHQRARARDDLGLSHHDVAVAVLAALSPEKRLQDAVAATAAVPRGVLLVAGEGPERPRLEALAAAGADVRLLGSLADVRPLLHAADVALLTSGTEGVPGALVQAGLSGLPAVGTRVGYTHEVVLDRRTGRLTGVGDVPGQTTAVQESLAHAADWGAAGRAHCVQAFGRDAAAARWDRVLAAATSPAPVT